MSHALALAWDLATLLRPFALPIAGATFVFPALLVLCDRWQASLAGSEPLTAALLRRWRDRIHGALCVVVVGTLWNTYVWRASAMLLNVGPAC